MTATPSDSRTVIRDWKETANEFNLGVCEAWEGSGVPPEEIAALLPSLDQVQEHVDSWSDRLRSKAPAVFAVWAEGEDGFAPQDLADWINAGEDIDHCRESAQAVGDLMFPMSQSHMRDSLHAAALGTGRPPPCIPNGSDLTVSWWLAEAAYFAEGDLGEGETQDMAFRLVGTVCPAADSSEKAASHGQIGHWAWLSTLTSRWEREGTGPDFPLKALVSAYRRRPRPASPAPEGKRRILTGRVYHAEESDPRVPKLYSPATHTLSDGKAIIPGFQRDGGPPLAIPLELWHGIGGKIEFGNGRGWPLSLRLFVGALLYSRREDRHGLYVLDLHLPLREVKRMVYPNSRRSDKEFWPAFNAAVEQLERAPRIPVYDSRYEAVLLRRLVSVPAIPNSPRDLDSPVIIRIDLPQGSENGPMIDKDILATASKDAPGACLLLNLAAYWYKPGQTHRPAGRRAGGQGTFWAQSPDPGNYPYLTWPQWAELAFPTSEIENPKDRVYRVKRLLKEYQAARKVGDVVSDRKGARILPYPFQPAHE